MAHIMDVGDKIPWGEETVLMVEAADCIDHMRTRLTQIASGVYRDRGQTAEEVAKDGLLQPSTGVEAA